MFMYGSFVLMGRKQFRFSSGKRKKQKCHFLLKIPVGFFGTAEFTERIRKSLARDKKGVCECKFGVMYYSIGLLRTSDLRGSPLWLGFDELPPSRTLNIFSSSVNDLV